jgi:SAM-dependent methyltransferase
MIRALKSAARRMLGPETALRLLAAAHWGPGRRCPVCGARVRRFLPPKYNYRVLRELRVVGGIPRAADECPVCRANERTRLLYLYLRDHTRLFAGGERTLHVAPERAIVLKARSLPADTYICGDMDPGRYLSFRPMVPLDVEALPFPDASFDLIICNHVLEHVGDDRRAMRELWRALKPSGRAILQVPIAERLTETREDASVVSPEARAAVFGQPDHVRLYAEGDYIARLSGAGFRVEMFDAYREDPENAWAFDVNPYERLFVCWRPSSA